MRSFDDLVELRRQLVGWFAVVFTAVVLVYLLAWTAGALLPDLTGLPEAVVGGLVALFVLEVYMKIRAELKRW